MTDKTDKTQTMVGVEDARVVIRHSRPVGTQWLTPLQAKTMGEALIQAALMAEAAQN